MMKKVLITSEICQVGAGQWILKVGGLILRIFPIIFTLKIN